MANSLHEKRILLVGAAGGLGRAAAHFLRAEGARVVASDVRAPADGDGDGEEFVAADLRDEAEVARLIRSAAERLGGLDGLANCAGWLAGEDGDAAALPLAAWQETISVNLTAAFLLCKHALPLLLAEPASSIVHVSSVAARAGSAIPQLAYTASKGGLEAMTRELAVAHARQGLRANCIALGPVRTQRNQHYFDTPAKLAARLRHIPMGRLGTPEEAVALIGFLLSDAAAYITGASLAVDGGITAAYLASGEED